MRRKRLDISPFEQQMYSLAVVGIEEIPPDTFLVSGGAGSDLTMIKTEAEKKGDKYNRVLCPLTRIATTSGTPALTSHCTGRG